MPMIEMPATPVAGAEVVIERRVGNAGLSPIPVPSPAASATDGRSSPVRIIVQLGASIAIGLFAANLSSWLYAHIYAYTQDLKLSELSEDFAMGFYAFLIALATFVLSVPLAYFLIQRRFSAKNTALRNPAPPHRSASAGEERQG